MASDITQIKKKLKQIVLVYILLYSFIFFIFYSFLLLNYSQKRKEQFRKVPAWFAFRNMMNIIWKSVS